MASYSVNDRALAHARKLIEGRQYVLRAAHDLLQLLDETAGG
jgi:hypothetical protein